MNATGIPVPDGAVAELGSAKNPPVTVTVAGYSYRSTVASRDGKYIVSLSAAHREASGLAAGDEVEVTLELDDKPRTMEIPDDLAAALAKAGLLEAFAALSYSKQRGYVEPLLAAKAPETRQRRVEKIVASMMGAG